ncbi:MarR family transcriptional regulator [Orenia metallireducens]|jgi:DNA-binding MarR family transcriptional regulator|uniref:Transcriptional regulator, MarR family n=1 Tax=Orenia metallireducens TaxID=1413210 RepID=A0A285GC67_9FIRM|nr:MarR family transcriptional regulator [Orenia metallireducens]PRX32504.1 MarR family transcriptional regulator [Orenia metallireducens]SNY21055.1 transcriptional regulator, MarR family [Orenia metallireducens]
MNTDNSIKLINLIRQEANNFLLKELKKIGLENIAPSHGDIFFVLFKNNELTMTEIANKINRDRSTVTTLVRKLMKLGYLDEKENPEDRRSSIIFLTKKGQGLKDDFDRISKKLYQMEYQGIKEEEKELFLKLLNKIYSNFK